jgi:hypothetical protein
VRSEEALHNSIEGNIVVAGNHEHGNPGELVEKSPGVLELATLRSLREIAAHDDRISFERGSDALESLTDCLDVGSPEVQV